MKRIFSCISFCTLLLSFLQGQKPVAAEAIALYKNKTIAPVSLFKEEVSTRSNLDAYVSDAVSMTIRQDLLRQITSSRPGLLHLRFPSPLNCDLDLYQVDILSATARIKTSDGLSLLPNQGNLFYRGIIHGNSNSIAMVSVIGDHIQIVYSDEHGNKRIQQTTDGSYIAYEDKNLLMQNPMNCATNDMGDQPGVHDTADPVTRNLTGNCVEVYVECDFKSYQDNGSSVTNTENWATALWHEVSTLYANESIPVMVSDIFVYTSSFPAFDTLTTTGAVLSAFVNHMSVTSYNGRLAHFLSTRGLGGGIAYIDVICSSSNMCAVSTSLSTSITAVPTYSWNVEVVTHEMGHNMGSQHTHACAWNNNNTAIDGCGPQAGYSEGCTGPIPASGTIMSYCHLISAGINFNNGFGPQPGDRIRLKYNNATCNTGTCALPACTSLTNPAPGSTNADINVDLSWTSTQSANGYRLTVGTTPGGSNIANNIDVGLVTTYDIGAMPYSTTIYVKIVPYNQLGSAVGCAVQSFTTEANVTPACTHLTSPLNGATNVALNTILKWTHSVGNQTGYKITVGTTPGGTQIANQLNVGNVTTYDPPGLLPHTSTLYVKITPYNANGDITGCSTESFSTVVPVNGDFCSMAISLPCGASLTGNTTPALSDPEAFTCGTVIGAPGLWYTFVGNGQTTVISTCSQYSYDTQLNAYSGSCSGLTCITGIDDFCAQGSQITFATTNNVNYYVFVQGWDGATGSYTITRSCYTGPAYCQASGYYPYQEWISGFSFGTYTKTSGSASYSDFTSETINVSRGASYSFSITPGFLQGALSDYYRIWIDLNRDGDFADSGEQLYAGGLTTSSVSGTIAIPLTSSPGITRMRVAIARPETPSYCGTYQYGEVEDYNLNIKCNLVTSALDDAGNGTLRNVSVCAEDNENILFAPALNNQVINISNGPMTVDGAWKWMPDAGTNITIKATQSVLRILSVPATKSIEMQNLTLIGGTAATGSVVDNSGLLILRNTLVRPATSSTTIPIRNAGTMNVSGNTNVRN